MEPEREYRDLMEARKVLRVGMSDDVALYVRLKVLHAMQYLDGLASTIAESMCEQETQAEDEVRLGESV